MGAIVGREIAGHRAAIRMSVHSLNRVRSGRGPTLASHGTRRSPRRPSSRRRFPCSFATVRRCGPARSRRPRESQKAPSSGCSMTRSRCSRRRLRRSATAVPWRSRSPPSIVPVARRAGHPRHRDPPTEVRRCSAPARPAAGPRVPVPQPSTFPALTALLAPFADELAFPPEQVAGTIAAMVVAMSLPRILPARRCRPPRSRTSPFTGW